MSLPVFGLDSRNSDWPLKSADFCRTFRLRRFVARALPEQSGCRERERETYTNTLDMDCIRRCILVKIQFA